MNTEVKDKPLNADLLYVYLLNVALFPVGHTGSSKQYLKTITQEHERHGGLPSTVKDPLQEITGCLKHLKNRGYYELPYRNLWQRIEHSLKEKKQNQDEAAAMATIVLPVLVS